MLPRLIHYSVTFTHISDSGIMDGFQAFDVHSFSESNAINRCLKKFTKLRLKNLGKQYRDYINTWSIDCEVI